MIEDVTPMQSRKDARRARVRARVNRDVYKEKFVSGEIQVSGLFSTDQDLLIMRQNYSSQFFETFKQGFELYQEGYWAEAMVLLKGSHKLKGDIDGPATNILEFMARHNYLAPDNWNGVRELNE